MRPMSRARAKFTQADVYRAVRGATRAGITVGRVEIEADKIVIVVGGSEAPDVLDHELAEFQARNGQT